MSAPLNLKKEFAKDVLAASLYALGTLPTFARGTQQLADVQATAIMDDLNLVGPPNSVIKAFDNLAKECEGKGMDINAKKIKSLVASCITSSGRAHEGGEGTRSHFGTWCNGDVGNHGWIRQRQDESMV